MTTTFPTRLFRLHTLAASLYLVTQPSLANNLLIDDAIEHVEVSGESPLGSGAHRRELDKAVIENRQAATSDTASLLGDIAGVNLQGAGGLSSLPVIHGLADDRIRVKVNGMDLIAACPNHMNPPLSYMAPSEVGNITVFVGVTPVSQGGDNIGGAIIANSAYPVFTPSNTEATTQGQVGMFYRSNNEAYGGNVALSHSREHVYFSYQGNWSQADNYIAGGNFKTDMMTGRPGHSLALDEVGSTAYKTQNHNARLAFKVNDSLVDLQLSYQDMPLQLYPNQRMDLLNNEQLSIVGHWQHEFDWGQLSGRIYHEKVEHGMDFGADKKFWYGSNSVNGAPCSPIRFMGDPDGTCAAGMPMYSDATNNGAEINATLTLGKHDELRTGILLQRFTLDDYWTPSGGGMGPGTFLNINNGQRDRNAIFIEREHQTSVKWSWLYGVRVEQVNMNADDVNGYSQMAMAPGMQVANATAFNNSDRDTTDTNIDTTILTRYHWSNTLQLELALARTVRSPNLYEKYTWSYWAMAAAMNNMAGDGNGYVGNVGLEPEVAYTLSTALNWHSSNQQNQITVSPYYTKITDYIDAQAASTAWSAKQFNILQFVNQEARLFGIDISSTFHLAHNHWGHWNLDSQLSYTNGKNTQTHSGLYQVVPLQGSFSLRQQNDNWDNSLQWQWASAKTDVSDIRNELPTAGYGILHLRFSRQWQNVKVDFGVENLFDKLYFLPSGGTYTGQGMTMSLNGIPYGIAVPGMGRSVYAGLQLSF